MKSDLEVQRRLNTIEGANTMVDSFESLKAEQAQPAAGFSTSSGTRDRLPEALLERILTRLGLNRMPDPTHDSLCTLYNAWCRCVPFDNLRKLIHIRSGATGPLPASTAVDFFEGWLKYGTGGTCWAGAGAAHGLLLSLGFDALRGIGTMLVNPDLSPNHGTVFVRFDERLVLFDSSILHGVPLDLDEHAETAVEHPAWGVRCIMRNSKWHVSWRPLNRLDGFECRLDSVGAAREEFETRHEQTRSWSPFNYQLTARLNCGNDVIGIAFGHRVTLYGDGRITKVPHSEEERSRLLIEELGLAEEIVARLPIDVPTPPPPSRTASVPEAAT